MTRRITIMPLAQAHLETVTQAIATRHGTEVADRAFDDMATVFAMLARFPRNGHQLPQNPAHFRFLNRHVRIVYEFDESELRINAVIPARMSFRPGVEA